MTLKTLKDFEETGNIERYHCLIDLKQEAIKWVKKNGYDEFWFDHFKNFFNITEEDLK